tara:strand:+ start:125662 stop:126849 length:1188 start_codon:yes stop_codon:yes gene_type:complete
MQTHAALMDMAVLLAAAFAGGAILQKLHQPVMVGYILVGFILGPSVSGLIDDKHQIETLAELGILLLLFIVGLELDLKKFARVYRAALIVTAAQIIVSLGAIYCVGQLFDWSIERIILIGFAISLSSTAVAIKLLQEMKELNTTLGRAAVGILIAQDIAVIPMILIIGAMGDDHFTLFAGVKIILAMGFMACVIATLSYRPQWFLVFVEKLPFENQFAVSALTMCIVTAALSGMAGLSPAYGAFIAGLIIGHTTKRSIFEESVKPIFEVLMMVFFLSVGLLLDSTFLIEKFWRIALLLGLLMFLKTFLNVSVLYFLGFSRRNALIIGAALGQIGEFSFILAALGLSAATIMEDGYKYVVSLIALSLIVTPFWLFTVRKMNLIRHKSYKKRHIKHG